MKEYGNFAPISDFEKLLFANDYIKALKKDIKTLQYHIGVSESDNAEMIYTNKAIRIDDSKQIQIHALEAKNKKLKRNNDELIKELVKLRLIININDKT